MQNYYNNGIKRFFFLDLEFLGPNKKFHEHRRELFIQIKEQFPDITIMLYSRADTLLKFDQFELMKEAGLYNVYLGAESFFPEDLIALKKSETSEQILEATNKLLDLEINIFLSLITFNRNTTIESLRYNLNVIDNLLMHKNAACLRIPAAFVNIEHSWDKGLEKYQFSNKSYTKWTLYFQSQSTKKFVFDNKFEPLIEIYRALAYENERKLTELNLIFTNQSYEVQKQLELWFANIDRYSIYIMKVFLEKFINHELSLDNLSDKLRVVFQMLQMFNDKYLPIQLSHLCTSEETFEMYKNNRIELGNHGFDEVIPPMESLVKFTHGIHSI